jgi:hypothetical protein
MPEPPSPPPDRSDMQSVTAQLAPRTRLDKILGVVPRALSSHVHILFLGALGVFLVLLPLFGVHVSARAELIGGNYTNVTSDLGACIVAGLTVHLVRRDRRRAEQLDDVLHAIHNRHDVLVEKVETAIAAAERAETAASGQAG